MSRMILATACKKGGHCRLQMFDLSVHLNTVSIIGTCIVALTYIDGGKRVPRKADDLVHTQLALRNIPENIRGLTVHYISSILHL